MKQTDEVEVDVALERSTLVLINGIASLAHSNVHAQQFRAATGLTVAAADIRVLEMLSGLPPTPISRIADALAIDLAQASRQVSRLVANGYLVRTVDQQDRRRTPAVLSDRAGTAMDRWLQLWSDAYRSPFAGWSDHEVADLAQWLAMVVGSLHAALPHQPVLSVDDRWDELFGPPLSPVARAAGRTIVALVTWIGQSQGFDDLLDTLDSPVRQSAFLTLRMVVADGPMTVSEVAARMSLDPSQASKRLSQLDGLGLVERSTAPADRRHTLVTASPEGVAFESHVLRTQTDSFRSTLPPITSARRRRWTKLTERYLAGLDFVDARSR